MKIFNILMYILYENGERIILIKSLIPKMHLNMTLLDLCVSAKMGHCGCMKRIGPGLSHKRPLFYIPDRMNIGFETGWLSKVNTCRKSSE